MTTSEIQRVELELDGLQQDEKKLAELRSKYKADFLSAEQSWKKSRTQKDLDAMVKAKGLLDTIETAQRDQELEIAKVSTYLKVIRESYQLDCGIMAVADNQLARLAELQSNFGNKVQDLQQHVADELVTLDEMRVEWDELHQEAWKELSKLGLQPEQVPASFKKLELDIASLKLVLISSSGQVDSRVKTIYELPLRNNADNSIRSEAEGVISGAVQRWLLAKQIQRDEVAWRYQQAERESNRSRYLGLGSGDE